MLEVPHTPSRAATSPPTALASSPAAAWDLAAEGWNRSTPLIRAWLRATTDAMLDAAHIEPGTRVLDIAAGAGDQTLDIARRVGPRGHVLATDISPRFVALALRNAQDAGLTHVEAMVVDAQRFKLEGPPFDAAVSRLGLMFCAQPVEALKAAHAALRPGGRFAAIVFDAPLMNPCIALMLKTALRHRGLAPMNPFAPGTLFSLGAPGHMQALLATAGFDDIEIRPMSAPFHLSGADAYIDFVRTSGSPIIELLAPLSADAQRAAWAEIAHELAQFQAQDGWHGPNGLLLCVASRPL